MSLWLSHLAAETARCEELDQPLELVAQRYVEVRRVSAESSGGFVAAGTPAMLAFLDAQLRLRVLQGTGFLLAYDDPVGVARELKAFCLKP